MEKPVISGIAHDRSQDKITVTDVPNSPGVAARVFAVVAEVGANIDMIVQNLPISDPTKANITFTLPEGDAQKALDALEAHRDEIGFNELRYNPTSASSASSASACAPTPASPRASFPPCPTRASTST